MRRIIDDLLVLSGVDRGHIPLSPEPVLIQHAVPEVIADAQRRFPDVTFTDEIPGYRERPDYLAGRNGFQVRDEIRMVRPGFYLGRAYIGRVFLLNFTLYNKEVADRDGGAFLKTGQSPEDCWSGTQRRATVTASN